MSRDALRAQLAAAIWQTNGTAYSDASVRALAVFEAWLTDPATIQRCTLAVAEIGGNDPREDAETVLRSVIESESWVWTQLKQAQREFDALPESVKRATDPSLPRRPDCQDEQR